MRLTRQVTHRGIRFRLVLCLIDMNSRFECKRRAGRLNFPEYLRVSLRIHAVGVPQQGKPHVLHVGCGMLLFRKPLPYLLFLPLQPFGQGTVLGEGC